MARELSFFLDRGLGSRVVAEGLREFGWSLTTMDERYGSSRSQLVRDVDWIGEASRAGGVILAKDRAMAKKPLEAEAIYYNEARIFVLSSSRVTGAQMLNWFLRNSRSIERMATQPGPFVFGVYEDRIARIRLNYP